MVNNNISYVSNSFFSSIFKKLGISNKAESQNKSTANTSFKAKKCTNYDSFQTNPARIVSSDEVKIDDDNFKIGHTKFPMETVEALERCGYDISELLTKEEQADSILSRITMLNNEFDADELKLMSKDENKVYGLGEFIAGGHKEIGIDEQKYLTFLKRMYI